MDGCFVTISKYAENVPVQARLRSSKRYASKRSRRSMRACLSEGAECLYRRYPPKQQGVVRNVGVKRCSTAALCQRIRIRRAIRLLRQLIQYACVVCRDSDAMWWKHCDVPTVAGATCAETVNSPVLGIYYGSSHISRMALTNCTYTPNWAKCTTCTDACQRQRDDFLCS